MAFLDNSGDIILDAVLTDAGRKRLARGDGTFKITKYAFGDDETTKLPQRIQYFNTLLAADSKELNLDRIQNDREKLEILVDKMSKMPNEEQIRKTQELMTEKNLTSMQRIKESAENK